jgi:hypothetical protein
MLPGHAAAAGGVCSSRGTGTLSLERAAAGVTRWHPTPGDARSSSTTTTASQGPAVPPAATAGSGAWQGLAHSLALEGRGVRRLPDMKPLGRLVVLSLAGNELSKVRGQGAAFPILLQVEELRSPFPLHVDELAAHAHLRPLPPIHSPGPGPCR